MPNPKKNGFNCLCRSKMCSEEDDPKVGWYNNDFLADEFGQIFDRGTGASITFAVAVLNELQESRIPRHSF